MISSEVQRTLVKSPPELWAELSDQATLARHLGELGEIRITRIDPEQAVEWEAEEISGTVLLKPSGWGTKVTLTVTREIPEPEPQAAESVADGESAVRAEPEATVQAEFESTMHAAFDAAKHVEPEPFAHAQFEPATHIEPVPLAQADLEPPYALEIEYRQAIAVEPAEAFDPGPARATRRSFFARLFRRGRPNEEAVEPEPHELIATVEPPPWLAGSPGPVTVAGQSLDPAQRVEDPYPTVEQTPEAPEMQAPVKIDEPVGMQAPVEVDESVEVTAGEPRDLSAELKAAEQATVEQVTAVLTAVLDRLGAAHHRPFSRA